jgi:tetratricopeptide (TPR) repeat protein
MRGDSQQKDRDGADQPSRRSCCWFTLETIGVTVSAFLVEGWGITQIAADPDAGLLDILFLHLGVSGFVLLWLAITLIRKRIGPEPSLIALTTLSLGPLGNAGILVMFVIYFLLGQHSQGFMDWYIALFQEENKTSAQDLFDRLETGRVRSEDSEAIVSFADFLIFGTPEQKQAILMLLAKNFRPAFGPVLLQAINDEDATIRVMAATAAAHVENDFLEKSLALKKQSEDRPNDFDAQMALAYLLDDYGFTGLLDPDRERENRTSASAIYRRCTGLEPNDARPWFAMGRLSLRGGDNAQAIACFHEALSLGKSRTDVAVWLIEAFFKEKRFGELRQLASELDHDLDSLSALNENVKRAVHLWRGESV